MRDIVSNPKINLFWKESVIGRPSRYSFLVDDFSHTQFVNTIFVLFSVWYFVFCIHFAWAVLRLFLYFYTALEIKFDKYIGNLVLICNKTEWIHNAFQYYFSFEKSRKYYYRHLNHCAVYIKMPIYWKRMSDEENRRKKVYSRFWCFIFKMLQQISVCECVFICVDTINTNSSLLFLYGV